MHGAVKLGSDAPAYLFALTFWWILWLIERAAGKLRSRALFAPLLFLATRRPVLIGWGVGTAGLLAYLWSGARAHGHDTPVTLLVLCLLSAYCGLGFSGLIIGPPFMIARALQPVRPFSPEPDETVLLRWFVSHFLRGEARGGTLLLTNRRLVFNPHRFNVQLASWNVPLDEIKALGFEGTRMLLVERRGQSEADWLVVREPRQVAEGIASAAGRGIPETLSQ